VNDMLDIAEGTLSEEERPVVHSDRGIHFRRCTCGFGEGVYLLREKLVFSIILLCCGRYASPEESRKTYLACPMEREQR